MHMYTGSKQKQDIGKADLMQISDDLPRTEEGIVSLLRAGIPWSLPFYCRVQWHFNHRESQAGEIWLAEIRGRNEREPISKFHTSCITHDNLNTQVEDFPDSLLEKDRKLTLWAYIDLSQPGQTGVNLYSSWESKYANGINPAADVTLDPLYIHYGFLFNRLFKHIQQSHISELSTTPTQEWTTLFESGKIGNKPYSRSRVRFGGIAECHWHFLDRYHSRRFAQKYDMDVETVMLMKAGMSSTTRSYLKYIIPQPRPRHDSTITGEPSSRRGDAAAAADDGEEKDNEIEVQVPSNLHFQPLQSSDLQTILDRSPIPRSMETVRQLDNIALYSTSSDLSIPVAWGLLSKEGTLASLHTEPEYRGRGLATLVARRLMALQRDMELRVNRREGGGGHVDGERVVEELPLQRFSQADVSEDNTASRKLMERLGGAVAWRVAWPEIEFGEEVLETGREEDV